jgi:mannose-1-phosphate guanylyltransferase
VTMVSALILSAGYGKRLGQLTQSWPKALLPVKGIPVLANWIQATLDVGCERVFVNTHYLSEIVVDYIKWSRYSQIVEIIDEPILQGTAGAISSRPDLFGESPLFVCHADNYTNFRLQKLRDHFGNLGPRSEISLVSFHTDDHANSGILHVDQDGRVLAIYEKLNEKKGWWANGAIYLMGTNAVKSTIDDKAKDIVTEVLPKYLTKLYTIKHDGFLIDIGTQRNYLMAQNYSSGLSFDEGVSINEFVSERGYSKRFKDVRRLLGQ